MSNAPSQSSGPAPAQSAEPRDPLVDAVADWLMDQTLAETGFEALIDGCCARLLAAGIPLLRAHVTFRVLHPLYEAMGVTWRRGHGVEVGRYPHRDGAGPSEPFASSPLWHMVSSGVPYLRRRLVGPEAVLDFPVLEEFRDAGATDYLGFTVSFGPSFDEGIVGSWITDRPSGFGHGDLRALQRIQRRLGVACKMRIREEIARNVVSTYLGESAGRRVLAGRIRRGDGESLRAAIWYSDLRGSTRMAGRMSQDAYIATLNGYFECAGRAVMEQGGEILAFIGDAVLAIFPIDTDAGSGPAEACERALAACEAAGQRLDQLNAERAAAGEAALDFGLALHVGDVLFGNIGLPERVSFSVIGPTVNEVARLEALTKEVGRPVLASAAFASETGTSWESLGVHALRDVAEPFEVFAPAAPAARP